MTDLHFSFILVLLSIIILSIINLINIDIATKRIINFIFLSESVILTFFFRKFTFTLAFFLLVSSVYFLNKTISSKDYKNNDALYSNIYSHNKILGIVILLLIIVYELSGDGRFMSTGLLYFLIGSIFLIYDKIPSNYLFITNFTLLFFLILSTVFDLPNLSYKFLFNYQGTDTQIPSLFLEEDVVFFLLTRPLSTLLDITGYTTFADGDLLYYENTVSGLFVPVEIADSCSGIYSIWIFLSALTSYYYVSFRKFDRRFLFILMLGLILSYIANLFRMYIIVLVGHYYGSDMLVFVHEYFGWLIFTLWLFIFWYLLDKYELKNIE